MRTNCENFADDARQLWRRLVFNYLSTNVDDHLQNVGFLYCGNIQWRQSPAFDLNQFPDKVPESKTWLIEDTGPIASLDKLFSQAPRFELQPTQARAVVARLKVAVKRWREVAAIPEVGLNSHEMNDFRAAFQGNAAD